MTHILNPADTAFADALRSVLPEGTLEVASARYLEEPRGRYAGATGILAKPRTVEEVATLIRMAVGGFFGLRILLRRPLPVRCYRAP